MGCGSRGWKDWSRVGQMGQGEGLGRWVAMGGRGQWEEGLGDERSEWQWEGEDRRGKREEGRRDRLIGSLGGLDGGDEIESQGWCSGFRG